MIAGLNKTPKHKARAAYTYRGKITITEVKPEVLSDGRNGTYVSTVKHQTVFKLENGATGYYIGVKFANEGDTLTVTVMFKEAALYDAQFRKATKIWIK